MKPERQNEIWAILDAESKTAIRRLWYNTPHRKDETKLLEMLFGRHNLTAQAEEKPNTGVIGTTPLECKFEIKGELTTATIRTPKFKIGDKVVYGPCGIVGTISHIKKSNICSDGFMYDIVQPHCQYSNVDECDLVLYTEPYHEPKEDETTQKSPSHGENEPNLHVSEREMTQKSPSGQNRSLSQDVADCDIETKEEEALLRMEYITMMEEKKAELKKLREQMNDRYSQYRLDLAKEIAVAAIPALKKDFALSEIGILAAGAANEIVKRLKETEE